MLSPEPGLGYSTVVEVYPHDEQACVPCKYAINISTKLALEIFSLMALIVLHAAVFLPTCQYPDALCKSGQRLVGVAMESCVFIIGLQSEWNELDANVLNSLSEDLQVRAVAIIVVTIEQIEHLFDVVEVLLKPLLRTVYGLFVVLDS